MKENEENKINRKSLENNKSSGNELNLNSSNIKLSSKYLSISPKHKSSIKNNITQNENINFNFRRNLMRKHISVKNINRFQYGYFKPSKHNSNINIKNNNLRRKSVEFMQTKTKKFFKKYSLEDMEKFKVLNNNNNEYINYINENSLDSQITKLENNIKIVLNNMRLKIEKEKDEMDSHLNDNNIQKNIKNKFCTSPNLKFILKKKKISHKCNSINVKNRLTLDSNTCLNSNKEFKRSYSYDFSEQKIKKIFKRVKSKIFKKMRFDTLYHTKIIEIDSSDESIHNEYSNGFSFDPKSNFILIFEIFLVIGNLYYFITIPLRIAKNENIGEDKIDKIIILFIDLIYIADFIITIFKGYYNHDMEIIRNNKIIFIHYLKQDFFMDLIEAIPLTFIINGGVFKNNMSFGVSNFKNIFLKLMAFIKPFKIFKIIKRKNSLVLEDFFAKFNESYRLEELAVFIISFLIFFLFVHLFICLHIFLSLQSYPNWITHINIENKNFFKKYITSFYFLVTTMTTVGYGDIVCISFIERIYHIILLTIGTIIYTFLISKIGNYLRDESREHIKLSNDLNILENIRVSYPSMPFKLYFKIKSHLLNISNKRKKTGISMLINGIPDTIKIDLLFKIYAKIINEFSIFKNVKNSNFIIQVLTSFIPITLKKEEIVLLEGEIVENIIFVKDGRLSMEIIIDIKDPYKSIQKYIENNFEFISRRYLRNLNKIKSANTVMSRKKINYKELKNKIDNFLLDQQKIVNDNNSLLDHNGFSVDLGRLDFSKKQSDLNFSEDYEIVKIFDVRKNEYFGEVNMFLDKPSPYTLKTKSRIGEIFLLRKQEALHLSNNFPNIWRKIHNKSYHNLVSLKKLTIKTLKQYYNSHFYHKNKNEKPFTSNLDNSSSIISFLEKPSFLRKINNNERLNLIKPCKNMINDNNIKTIKSTKIFKNNLYFEKNRNDKRKSSVKTLKNNYGFINDGSQENSNLSSLKFTQSSVKPSINIISNNFENSGKNENDENNLNTNTNKKLLKTKSSEKFTFKEEEEDDNKINNNLKNLKKKYKSDKSIGKRKKKSTSRDYYQEIIESMHDMKKDNQSFDTILNKNRFYNNEDLQNIINNFSNEEEKIFTLKDIDAKFSKKIRKKIKMRKKIEKLKHSLELKRKEKSKNLIALYTNIISKKINLITNNTLNEDIYKNINNSLAEELINTTISEYNNENFSELFESTTSEEDTPKKFNIYSLKKIPTISFEIKSSYKNINVLSKGEILVNKKYKKFLENMIKQNSHKKFFNKVEFKRVISKYSLKTTKNKKNNFIRSSTDKFHNKNNMNKKNSLVPKSKFKTAFLNNINSSSKFIVNVDISSKNENNEFDMTNKVIQNTKKKINDKVDDSKNINDVNNSNVIYESNNNEQNNHLNIIINNNNNDMTNFLNKIKDERKLFQPKNIENKSISLNNNNIINNKSYSSSINCFNEIDKDNLSKNDNNLKILNRKKTTYNSLLKDIYIDNENEHKKNAKCIIF